MRSVAAWLLAVMLAGMGTSGSHGQERPTEDDLIGDWVLPESGAVIHTYRCGDEVCGQIVKVPDPARRDIHNPDPALRRRPLLGIVVAPGLSRKGPTSWEGEFYNSLNGYTYTGTLNLVDRERFTFVGCLIGPLFCHTKTYYRVEPPSPPKQPSPQRAVSSRERPPVAKAKSAKPARKKPSEADFEAFLKDRGVDGNPNLTDKQRQELFTDFMAWWISR